MCPLFRAMRDCLLRKQKGLRPYASAKPLAASRLAGLGYPKTNYYFECPTKLASFRQHHKTEYVAASAAAEAIENFLYRVNVEARMALFVERT